jgi:hypothetical protein
MISPNEFWLQLHRLSEAYLAEGLSTKERAEHIVGQFRDMAAPARRQLMTDLLVIAVHVPELYPVIQVAAQEESQPPKLEPQPQDPAA